jgi:hypothetical protein
VTGFVLASRFVIRRLIRRRVTHRSDDAGDPAEDGRSAKR